MALFSSTSAPAAQSGFQQGLSTLIGGAVAWHAADAGQGQVGAGAAPVQFVSDVRPVSDIGILGLTSTDLLVVGGLAVAAFLLLRRK